MYTVSRLFPPSRHTLSVSMLNVELAFITGEINDMLNVETNLTLVLDRWTSPS
ncbi:8914_t:CDS:2, partial [Entrophospora sp. SA101]